MSIRDGLADRQSDPRSGIFGAGVKSSERVENRSGLPGWKADAFVLDHQFDALIPLSPRGHLHPRRIAGLVIFDRVADEIADQVDELRPVSLDRQSNQL